MSDDHANPLLYDQAMYSVVYFNLYITVPGVDL